MSIAFSRDRLMWPNSCKLILILRLFSLSLEHPVWFPLAHHLLTIGIESVIDHPLGRIQIMVVLEAQVLKAFSNSFKSCAFGFIPERIIGISSINNYRAELTQDRSLDCIFSISLRTNTLRRGVPIPRL